MKSEKTIRKRLNELLKSIEQDHKEGHPTTQWKLAYMTALVWTLNISDIGKNKLTETPKWEK